MWHFSTGWCCKMWNDVAKPGNLVTRLLVGQGLGARASSVIVKTQKLLHQFSLETCFETYGIMALANFVILSKPKSCYSQNAQWFLILASSIWTICHVELRNLKNFRELWEDAYRYFLTGGLKLEFGSPQVPSYVMRCPLTHCSGCHFPCQMLTMPSIMFLWFEIWYLGLVGIN